MILPCPVISRVFQRARQDVDGRWLACIIFVGEVYGMRQESNQSLFSKNNRALCLLITLGEYYHTASIINFHPSVEDNDFLKFLCNQ